MLGIGRHPRQRTSRSQWTWPALLLVWTGTAIAQSPDLTINAIPASSYVTGQTGVQIPVAVYRSGGQLTPGTYVHARLYFSTNSVWDGSDTLLWSSNDPTDFPSNTLNSNGSRTVTATVNIPSVSSGSRYIIDHGDSTNFHSESNTGNNEDPNFVTIAALPDMTINAIPASSYVTGQAGVQIPVTVYRSGGKLTPGTYVHARLYFSMNRD